MGLTEGVGTVVLVGGVVGVLVGLGTRVGVGVLVEIINGTDVDGKVSVSSGGGSVAKEDASF